MQTITNVRLTGGKDRSSGRLEVLVKEVWYTVCNRDFGREEASVVCAQLSRGNSGKVVRGPPGTGPILPDGLDCRGSERDLLNQCRRVRRAGQPSCRQADIVYIQCG